MTAHDRTRLASSKMTIYLVHPQRQGEQPHEALANMGDDDAASKAFVARWGPLWEEKMVKGIEPILTGEELQKVWRVERDQLRAAWRGDKKELAELGEKGMGSFFRWRFTGKRAELLPNDLWAALVGLFLRDHAAGRTAICANPNCPNPYFIRKRKTQKYCDAGPCVEYGARLRANLWWARHGNEWREKRKGEK